MATRGVFQLTRLSLHYCEQGGSSRSIREYMLKGRLAEWARQHSHVEIAVQQRNGHHPYVQADYVTMAASHQISVKNVDSWRDVEKVLDLLSNRSGRKITKITQPVLTDTPSIQGVWTPFLNLQEEPDLEITIEKS